MKTFTFDEFSNVQVSDVAGDAAPLLGDGNTLPVVSNVTLQDTGSVLEKLGSVDYVKAAKDVGTAVGTFQRRVDEAKHGYANSLHAAQTGNSLGSWWQYASTTDKLVVGLAVVTIIIMLDRG